MVKYHMPLNIKYTTLNEDKVVPKKKARSAEEKFSNNED